MLIIDHPRVPRVVLGWFLRRDRAEDRARRLAADLGLVWYDAQGLLHVPRPAGMAMGELGRDTPPERLAVPEGDAPVDVLVACGRGTAQRWRFAPPLGLSGSMSLMLFYAGAWCLWSWTSLLVQWARPITLEQTLPHRGPVLWLLGSTSVFGLLLLGRVLLGCLGEEVVMRRHGNWCFSRRWLGIQWGWRRLGRVLKREQLRRVEPPGEEAGLWLTLRRDELCLGSTLGAESLQWLHRRLLTAEPAAEPLCPPPSSAGHPPWLWGAGARLNSS